MSYRLTLGYYPPPQIENRNQREEESKLETSSCRIGLKVPRYIPMPWVVVCLTEGKGPFELYLLLMWVFA